jgi:hypothetical protein
MKTTSVNKQILSDAAFGASKAGKMAYFDDQIKLATQYLVDDQAMLDQANKAIKAGTVTAPQDVVEKALADLVERVKKSQEKLDNLNAEKAKIA